MSKPRTPIVPPPAFEAADDSPGRPLRGSEFPKPDTEVTEQVAPEHIGGQRRGYGYIRDTHDTSKDPTAKGFFGARRHGATPPMYSLEAFVDKIHDQLRTSSCVGFAIAGAIMMRLAVMGIYISWPSPVAFYTFARAIDRMSPNLPLEDFGCMPFQAIRGANEWGVPSNDAWPFSESTINDEPTLDRLQSAATFTLTGYYRIDTYGKSRVEDICTAISEGYPVMLGVQVDQAFEDCNDDTPLVAPLDSLGGHMLCIVGYKPNPHKPGEKLFRIRNQWGTSWGDRGYAWAEEFFVTNVDADDFYVVTAAAAA